MTILRAIRVNHMAETVVTADQVHNTMELKYVQNTFTVGIFTLHKCFFSFKRTRLTMYDCGFMGIFEVSHSLNTDPF